MIGNKRQALEEAEKRRGRHCDIKQEKRETLQKEREKRHRHLSRNKKRPKRETRHKRD